MSVEILIGDVRARLRDLPSDSFDCVVTSPPYWGLRDYGVDGQLGLERTLAEHLDVMIDVFRDVRRVLRPSGTCWVNYGDCYATQPNGRSAAATKAAGGDDRTFRDKPFSTVGPVFDPDATGQALRVGRSCNLGHAASGHAGGRVVAGGYLKPKDLVMLPNRFAIAMQDDGWWVRSEIIWAKPNAMPDSSGRFRPATAHEKIFLFAKSDAPAFWVARDTGDISSAPDMAERCMMATRDDLAPRWIALGHYYDAGAVRVPAASGERERTPTSWDGGAGAHGSFHRSGRGGGARTDKQRGHSRRHAGFNARWDAMSVKEQRAKGRFLRNWEPAPLPVWPMATAAFRDAHFATFPPELVARCLRAGCPRGGRVLDPFGGAGTTGLVADRLGLDATLIEINPVYAEIARARIDADGPGLFGAPVHVSAPAAEGDA